MKIARFISGCLSLALLFLNSANADPLQTVVFSGDATPGIDGSFSFSSTPILNDAGHATFFGSFTGTGVTNANGQGIFSEAGGSGLALVARKGDHAPGTGQAVKFDDLLRPVLTSNDGTTAFVSSLKGTGVNSLNDRGIFSDGSGNGLALVAREGNAAPGTATGVNYGFLGKPVLNNAGQTAFFASLRGTGITGENDHAIFSEGSGNGLTLVAREGDAAPGDDPQVLFGSLFVNPVLNTTGQTAFRAELTGVGVDASNNTGIFREGMEGGLFSVAREGDNAPGLSSGVKLGDFQNVVLNNSGQTAFSTQLVGAGITSTNDIGIYTDGSGSGLAMIAREGNAAPGTETGVSFSDFRSIVINSSGQTAFSAVLSGVGINSFNDQGLFSEGGGNGIALVARKGDSAPGTGDGVNFSSFGSLVHLVLNGSGQTAFSAQLSGTGVVDANDRGIFAHDQAGDLQIIVREGDLVNVSDNPLTPDFRTIRILGQSTVNTGNQDGLQSDFNDQGKMVFSAIFTDGSSGIFVSDLVASNSSGDFDSDGDVDGADFLEWQRSDTSSQGLMDWQLNYGVASTTGDFDSDGDVDGADFLEWQRSDASSQGLMNWQLGYASAATTTIATAIPEPSSLILLALAGLAISRREQRARD